MTLLYHRFDAVVFVTAFLTNQTSYAHLVRYNANANDNDNDNSNDNDKDDDIDNDKDKDNAIDNSNDNSNDNDNDNDTVLFAKDKQKNNINILKAQWCTHDDNIATLKGALAVKRGKVLVDRRRVTIIRIWIDWCMITRKILITHLVNFEYDNQEDTHNSFSLVKRLMYDNQEDTHNSFSLVNFEHDNQEDTHNSFSLVNRLMYDNQEDTHNSFSLVNKLWVW